MSDFSYGVHLKTVRLQLKASYERKLRDFERKLERAESDLERAKNQKTNKVYRDGEFVYEADTNAIRKAQEKILDLKDRIAYYEDLIASLE